MGIRIDHPSGRVMVRGEKPQPVRESDRAWKNLESRVLAAAIVMRGGDVGAKINEVERMQSLGSCMPPYSVRTRATSKDSRRSNPARDLRGTRDYEPNLYMRCDE